MPDWQERITRDTAPAIRVEHDVRYATAAPLILESAVWADLGCGSGVSAGAALAGGFGGHAILVDIEASAVDDAAAELGIGEVTKITADLSAPDDVARVREALRKAPAGPRMITCFETVEHLKTFVPLVEAFLELAAGEDVTIMLSVPNDAHWAIENPFHETAWSDGAFEELRRLLPGDAVIARQVPLTGSALVLGDGPGRFETAVDVPPGHVPSHFLAALGPRATQVAAHAAAAPMDLDAQRTWERQRESDLAFYERSVDEYRRIADEHIARVDEFRAYIHDLEDQLGLPRSGTPERAAYDAAQLPSGPGGA